MKYKMPEISKEIKEKDLDLTIDSIIQNIGYNVADIMVDDNISSISNNIEEIKSMPSAMDRVEYIDLSEDSREPIEDINAYVEEVKSHFVMPEFMQKMYND